MNRRDQFVEHLTFASELGVRGVSRDPAWRLRPLLEQAAPITPAVLDAAEEPMPNSSSRPVVLLRNPEALADVRADVGDDCRRCKLHTLGRTTIVFGVGDPAAALMFIGEAPGADEDQQGIPFVGKAGQLLTKIIEAIEITREQVYIANVIKCRPPGNRNPEPDEVETCEPFLFRQIDVIKPRVIVTLGKFATQSLLRTEEAISKLRGRVFDYRAPSSSRRSIPRTC